MSQGSEKRGKGRGFANASSLSVNQLTLGKVYGEARVLARPSVLAEGVDGEHGPASVTVGSRVVQAAYQRSA